MSHKDIQDSNMSNEVQTANAFIKIEEAKRMNTKLSSVKIIRQCHTQLSPTVPNYLH